jgi:murein DD-endopeptidase MepM/ murein hydrolase activator NlpD
MAFRACTALLLVIAALGLAAPAQASGKASVAALQVALAKRGLYGGSIDGIKGPRTTTAIRSFQRRAGLTADGIVGPRTRAALGRWARRRLGSRPLRFGRRGWDVAALQYLLGWHGFPAGPTDGYFGARTSSAVRRYQAWARIGADGIAGRITVRALRRPRARSRFRFLRPTPARLGDRFGPRGSRFHTGLDFKAWYGEPVYAARSGRVVGAGFNPGGYGNLIVLSHGRGVRTYYAHLGRIYVGIGRRVRAGARIASVGSTGNATGPHLHFEVRVYGGAVDPLPALR